MSFLAKLGSVLAKGLAIAMGIEPLIAPYLGAKANNNVAEAVNDLTAIGQVVVSAEALLGGGGNGADKLKAATPLIMNILRTSELIGHKKIADEALFEKGATGLTSALADILNSVSDNTVKTN